MDCMYILTTCIHLIYRQSLLILCWTVLHLSDYKFVGIGAWAQKRSNLKSEKETLLGPLHAKFPKNSSSTIVHCNALYYPSRYTHSECYQRGPIPRLRVTRPNLQGSCVKRSLGVGDWPSSSCAYSIQMRGSMLPDDSNRAVDWKVQLIRLL